MPSTGFIRLTWQPGLAASLLPGALDRNLPQAPSEWRWQFVFPAGRICHDPRFGPPSRFHLHESVIQRAVTEAARRAGLTKRVTCHTFRHYAASRTMPSSFGACHAFRPMMKTDSA